MQRNFRHTLKKSLSLYFPKKMSLGPHAELEQYVAALGPPPLQIPVGIRKR